MSKLEQLKKEIQSLRPEIGVFCSNCQEELINGKHKYGATRIGKTYCSTGHISYRPITIEDVLAVMVEKDWVKNSTVLEIMEKWLLGKPLDDQSKETINFLFSLIVK